LHSKVCNIFFILHTHTHREKRLVECSGNEGAVSMSRRRIRMGMERDVDGEIGVWKEEEEA